MANLVSGPRYAVPSTPNPFQPVSTAIVFPVPWFQQVSPLLLGGLGGLHLLELGSVLLLMVISAAMPAIDRFVDHVSVRAWRLCWACGCVDSYSDANNSGVSRRCCRSCLEYLSMTTVRKIRALALMTQSCSKYLRLFPAPDTAHRLCQHISTLAFPLNTLIATSKLAEES